MLTATEIKSNEFLNWLLNRLKFKYKEDNVILNQVSNLLDNYILFPKKIPINFIDQICKKHYPDFEIDKTPDLNIGYSDKERMQIRNFVVSIIEDVSKL